MTESEEELKSLLMKVEEGSEKVLNVDRKQKNTNLEFYSL